MANREIKSHPLYDDLVVNELNTKQKVRNEFKRKKHLIANGRPKAMIVKHDISQFNINDFKVKQKVCPNCSSNGITSYIANPRLETDTTWVGICSKCGTAANFFNPTPVQKIVDEINAPIINVIAGFGSGKTEADMWLAVKRAITVDGAEIMIAGGSADGLKQAKGFLTGHVARPWKHTKDRAGDLVIQNEGTWKFKNGSIIRFLNVDTGSIEKFRSWQLDLAILIEASADAFWRVRDEGKTFWEELQARMRKSTANVPAHDEMGDEFTYIDGAGKATPFMHGTIGQIILESNPKNSDIISTVFDRSAVLITTEKVANRDKTINRFIKNYDSDINGESGIVSILASSNDNPMLTEKYLKQAFPPGTPPAKIARMRDADLSKNEGQVYQKAQECFAPRKSAQLLKTADQILHVVDPGTTDPTATLYAALWYDYEKSGKPKVHVFHAHKTKGGMSKEGNSLREICDHFDETEMSYGLTNYDIVNNKIDRSYIHPITRKKKTITRIADSAMWKSEKAGDELIQDHTNEAEKYRKRGFNFKQALKGQSSIEYGISIADTYMEEKIFEFAHDLHQLEDEFIKYEYEADNKGNMKPADKHNHLMDDIRYLAFEIDVMLGDKGLAPDLMTGDEKKIREVMERRRHNRTEREKAIDDLLGVDDFGFSRTETLEKFNKSSNKKWK